MESYSYGDFGMPSVFDASGNPLAQSQIGNPYLFMGYRYDPESGFYQLPARYLDPRAGRFITRDPIGIWGDALNLGNGLSFVGNNPNSFVDPLGYWSLAALILTGDANAPPDVYAAAKQQFQETLWDRTDATIKTLSAGKANANSLCNVFLGRRPAGQEDIVFDPTEQAKQACFTRCWAIKTADAIFGAVLANEGAGTLLNAVALVPSNPASTALRTDKLFDTAAKDVPWANSCPIGLTSTVDANGAKAAAAKLQALSQLSPAKQVAMGLGKQNLWVLQRRRCGQRTNGRRRRKNWTRWARSSPPPR